LAIVIVSITQKSVLNQLTTCQYRTIYIFRTRLPKNVFVGRKTLELGVYDAIITFNNGNLGRLEVFKHLGISDIGSNTIDALKVADKARIRKSEYAEGLASKESRVKRRRERLREEEVDDTEYCPGGF
ncbi:hypothetical protein J6590_015083, partial [Homalodisca vitripennis]